MLVKHNLKSPLFWRQSERLCRQAIIVTCNGERFRGLRRGYGRFFWAARRRRLVRFYEHYFGSVPHVLNAARLPMKPGVLVRTDEYGKWAIGKAMSQQPSVRSFS